MKSLDIIIPTLDEEEFLDALLGSLIKSMDFARRKLSAPPFFRVLVADCGSSDRTEEISGKYPVEFFKTEKKGRGNQINEAYQKSSGDFVLILHADHTVSENGLWQMTQCLGKNQYCEWGILGQDYDRQNLNMALVQMANSFRFKFRKIAFGDQGMFFRRSSLDKKGGFPAQPLMEDVELSLILKNSPSVRVGTLLTVSARRWDKQNYLTYAFQIRSLVRNYLKQRHGGERRVEAAEAARKRYELS